MRERERERDLTFTSTLRIDFQSALGLLWTVLPSHHPTLKESFQPKKPKKHSIPHPLVCKTNSLQCKDILLFLLPKECCTETSNCKSNMAKRSDFAQKLLDDLRVRKERIAASQSSNRSKPKAIGTYSVCILYVQASLSIDCFKQAKKMKYNLQSNVFFLVGDFSYFKLKQ